MPTDSMAETFGTTSELLPGGDLGMDGLVVR